MGRPGPRRQPPATRIRDNRARGQRSALQVHEDLAQASPAALEASAPYETHSAVQRSSARARFSSFTREDPADGTSASGGAAGVQQAPSDASDVGFGGSTFRPAGAARAQQESARPMQGYQLYARNPRGEIPRRSPFHGTSFIGRTTRRRRHRTRAAAAAHRPRADATRSQEPRAHGAQPFIYHLRSFSDRFPALSATARSCIGKHIFPRGESKGGSPEGSRPSSCRRGRPGRTAHTVHGDGRRPRGAAFGAGGPAGPTTDAAEGPTTAGPHGAGGGQAAGPGGRRTR